MTETPSLADWLFHCIAAEAALDRLQDEGISLRSSSAPEAVQQQLPLEDFSAPIRRSAMQAMPAYLGFFCLENSVRELIGDRLSERLGSDWWETASPRALKERVQQRKTKEGKDRWHVRRGEHEIYYTDFGDLKSLVQSQWEAFEDLFPDQNWLSSRLDELEASRNVIAHSNVLDDREIVRIRLYLQDWIRQVG
jgi:Swt1-like HEPN